MPTPSPDATPRRRPLAARVVPWLVLIVMSIGWQSVMALQRRQDFGTAWIGGWDDAHYLAWGRSLAVDGDWDFANDLAYMTSLASLPATAGFFRAALDRNERTPAGRVPNKYACGLGLLALPLLLLTRLGLELLAHFGYTGPPDPFSGLYVFAFTVSGMVWGIVGLAAAHRLLRRDYPPRAASAAVFLGALGLPLGYYVWFEPTMAHATGFAAATIHLLCVRAWADRAVTAAPEPAAGWKTRAFLMGLTLGVACLVRYTNIVLALVPIVLVRTARAGRPPADPRRALVRGSAALVAVGWLIAFAPQLVAWKVVYGSFLVYAYTNEILLPVPVHVFEVLVGPRSGLFLWTPLALLAAAGLWWGRRDRPWCRAGLVALAATTWIYSGWQMPWLGHSFGMRAFVDVAFFLLLGLAELIVRARTLPIAHPFRRARPLLTGLALVWALHLAVCYRALIQPPGEWLAPRSIVTEWGKWRHQIYSDTGLRLLVHRLERGS